MNEFRHRPAARLGRRALATSRPLLALFAAAGAWLALVSPAAEAQGYVAAEGGGGVNSGSWAPAVFGWMLQNAGGSGKVAILGVSGTDAAAANRFLQAGASQVVQLAITAQNANDPAVYQTLREQDVVWIRGGNQANYVQWWKGTLTEAGIRFVFDKGGAVGGTSAGCAILGELIYDSIGGSVTPKTALRNPWTPQITFTDDFLGLTPGVLFDTHFTERGRLGRLAVMVARAEIEHGRRFVGVGVDDRTAFCVYPDGTAEVIGEGSVTVLRTTGSTRMALLPGLAPLVTDLAYDQLVEGYVWDLATEQVIARPAHATLVAPPVDHPSFQTLTLNGSSAADAAQGQWQVLDGGDDLALFLGKLQVVPGAGNLGRTVVSTRVWDSTVWDENRVGGVQYALALHPHSLGVYLDGGTLALARDGRYLTALAPPGPESSLVVLDSHGITSRAFSQYLSSGAAQGPRQAVALEGAQLHLLRRGASYDAVAHRVDLTAPFGSGMAGCTGANTLAGLGLPTIGNGAFAVRAENGSPGGLGWLLVSTDPIWLGTTLPAFGIVLHVVPYTPIFLQLPFLGDGSGTATLPLPIPDLPLLAGTSVYAQTLWAWDPGQCTPTVSGLSSSNGLALTLLP